MRVSIIMCTYNERLQWVREAVESILNQTYKKFLFYIVVDNPNNKEIINYLEDLNDDRLRVIINEKNLGLVSSLNKALSLIDTEYIARMDADDIAVSNRLEEQIKFMDHYREIDLVGTGIEFIDEDDKQLKQKCKIITNNEDLTKMLNRRNCIYHPTWMFRRRILTEKNISQYREIPTAEDYDFLCRLITNKGKVSNIDKPLLKYRIRDNGISQSNIFFQESMRQYVITLTKERKKLLKDTYNSLYIQQLMKNDIERHLFESVVNQNISFQKIILITKCLFKSPIYRKYVLNKLF